MPTAAVLVADGTEEMELCVSAGIPRYRFPPLTRRVFALQHNPDDEFATLQANYERTAFQDGAKVNCVLYVDIHDPDNGPFLLLES